MTNIDIPSFKKPLLTFQIIFFFMGLVKTQLAISVRAVQGVFHRKKVLPQTLPIKLLLVLSK